MGVALIISARTWLVGVALIISARGVACGCGFNK